jgi:hypothetical protein
MSPAILGFSCLALVCLLIALGVHRSESEIA